MARGYFPKKSCQHWNIRNEKELDTEETGRMEGRSKAKARETMLKKGRDGAILTGKED